jgi:5-methylcytosine-specific restriction endonuclease McrA
VDCGEQDPVVLEFDHVGPKRKEISCLAAAGASVRLLGEEISRCEVVCVNCHRRRTGLRGGWRRAAVRWWTTPPPKRYETARNLAFTYSLLERSLCADCGTAEMVVLDFDHVGPKTGSVLHLAREGVGLSRLEAEIENCEIRCANCHRRRTNRQQRAMRAGG